MIAEKILAEIRNNNPTLTTYSLDGEGITSADVAQLADALQKNSYLKALDLSNNLIDNAGAATLAKNTTITYLNLYDNLVTTPSVLKNNSTITHLNLEHNLVTDEGIIALAGNTSIKCLKLKENKIGNATAIAFAKNTTLTDLDLSDNQIDTNGAIALAENCTLKNLDLSSNPIRDEGAIAFAKNTSLTQLRLKLTELSDNSAILLAKNKTIISLNLRSNQIGDEGAIALAKNTTLFYLNLGNNQIHDKGANAFLENKVILTLHLDLCHHIHDGNLSILKTHLKKNQSARTAAEERKKIFLSGLLVIVWDFNDPESTSELKKIPREILSCILNSISLTDETYIGKTPDQLSQCIHFLLFSNLQTICAVKIIEKIMPNGKNLFSLFSKPCIKTTPHATVMFSCSNKRLIR